MAAASITVSGLSKEFQVGRLQSTTNFREMLVDLARDPFRRMRGAAPTFWALKDVSFTVAPGEVVGIIGRNGAGKSTLLKLLSRISYPTSGSVRVQGRVSALLEVGTGFMGELTGRENVYLAGSILGMSRRQIEASFHSIVQFAGVAQFIDTPIKRYSSGMCLRLGFAVAAHLDADVLLVDEVLAVGDSDFQKKCLETMSDLHRGGRTVLFVSHNLAAVENLCSRAIWIDNGQVRMDARPKDVIKAYLSTAVAERSSEVDLGHVESRRGSGDIRLSKVQFFDTDGHPLKLLRSGDSLVVRLHYAPARRVEGPIFGLEIYTQLGTLVTQVHTYNAGFEIPFVATDGYIDVTIRDLNLMPGRYALSFFVANLGDLFHDVVEQCAILDVEASGRYGLGRGVVRNPIIGLASTWALGSSTVTADLAGVS